MADTWAFCRFLSSVAAGRLRHHDCRVSAWTCHVTLFLVSPHPFQDFSGPSLPSHVAVFSFLFLHVQDAQDIVFSSAPHKGSDLWQQRPFLMQQGSAEPLPRAWPGRGESLISRGAQSGEEGRREVTAGVPRAGTRPGSGARCLPDSSQVRPPGGEATEEHSRQEGKVCRGPKRRQPSRLSSTGLSRKAIQGTDSVFRSCPEGSNTGEESCCPVMSCDIEHLRCDILNQEARAPRHTCWVLRT